MRDLKFPDLVSNPGPLQCNSGVLTTGPPGKSLYVSFFASPVPKRFLLDKQNNNLDL